MEKIYCIYCGLEHEAAETICKACGKPLDPKEELLKDYLISKTKDELKGKTADKLYEIIKNFILSHLYGTIVAVSVVFVAASSVLGPDRALLPVYHEVVVYDEPVEHVEKTQEQWDLQKYIGKYIDIYGSDFDINPGEKDRLMDYRLPASYGYDGVFDMVDHKTGDTSILYGTKRSLPVINPEQPKTPLSSQLMKDGYKIAQMDLEVTLERYHGEGNQELLSERHYIVTAVYVNGQWYIAEEVLTYDSGK